MKSNAPVRSLKCMAFLSFTYSTRIERADFAVAAEPEGCARTRITKE